jgi:dTDP-4-dehydrorhamnose 3,5-epimerase
MEPILCGERVQVQEFEIKGPKLITPKIIGDERGFFCERFRVDQFKELDIDCTFLQDNYSRSAYGILRGLHYQWDQPQNKLVTCTHGRILDVAVDIRKNSPTFGKHLMVELSGDKPQWLWIPAGFAHGFLVLSETGADLSYKVDALWNAKGEGSLLWNDAELGIPWSNAQPILSEKDAQAAPFQQYKTSPRF